MLGLGEKEKMNALDGDGIRNKEEEEEEVSILGGEEQLGFIALLRTVTAMAIWLGAIHFNVALLLFSLFFLPLSYSLLLVLFSILILYLSFFFFLINNNDNNISK